MMAVSYTAMHILFTQTGPVIVDFNGYDLIIM